MDVLNFLIEAGFWMATIRMATPLIFGTLGELICERAGVLNLGIEDETTEALERIGLDLEDVCERERDTGLGNGGLGRLAACFMDSLASLQIMAVGYGLR